MIVDPKLDFDRLEPGARASEAIRAAAKSLGLDAAHGVKVRLTGPVPLRGRGVRRASPTAPGWSAA